MQKKSNDNIHISKGDLIHYCPSDMESHLHDIGIIYDILESYVGNNKKKTKIYKIFWSRSQDYDEFPERTIQHRLKMTIQNRHIMKIVKQNESIKTTL